MRQYQVKRYIVLILGIIIIGLGVAIFSKANLGIDPFTLMNMGISEFFNINFSIIQWGVSIGILVVVAFIDKKKIFIATILNMFLVAPLIEGFTVLIEMLALPVQDLFGRLIIAIIGCAVLSIGAGMYLATDLGVSAYDLVAIIISEKTNLPFKWLRIGTDAFCTLVGWMVGSVVGVGTLIAVFGMGPMISYARKKTETYLSKQPSGVENKQTEALEAIKKDIDIV